MAITFEWFQRLDPQSFGFFRELTWDGASLYSPPNGQYDEAQKQGKGEYVHAYYPDAYQGQ